MQVSIKRSIHVQIQDRILHQCRQYHTRPHQVPGGGGVSACPPPRLCDAKSRPLSSEWKTQMYLNCLGNWGIFSAMELTGFIGFNLCDHWKLFVILFYAAGYSTGGQGILVLFPKSENHTARRPRTRSGRHLNGDGLVSATAADNRAQSRLIGLMA